MVVARVGEADAVGTQVCQPMLWLPTFAKPTLNSGVPDPEKLEPGFASRHEVAEAGQVEDRRAGFRHAGRVFEPEPAPGLRARVVDTRDSVAHIHI